MWKEVKIENMILILYILFMNIYPAIWKIYIHKNDSITYLEICKEMEIIILILQL